MEDCETGGLECTGGADYDCHFDLRIFPRTAGPGTPLQTLEVFDAVRSLDFDGQNDLILLQGDDEVRFIARTQLGAPSASDVGSSPPVVERTSYGAGAGASIRYCD